MGAGGRVAGIGKDIGPKRLLSRAWNSVALTEIKPGVKSVANRIATAILQNYSVNNIGCRANQKAAVGRDTVAEGRTGRTGVDSGRRPGKGGKLTHMGAIKFVNKVNRGKGKSGVSLPNPGDIVDDTAYWNGTA